MLKKSLSSLSQYNKFYPHDNTTQKNNNSPNFSLSPVLERIVQLTLYYFTQ